MPVNTSDEFIGVLQKSGLLNAEQLAECRRLANGLSEPTAIARKLVQHNLLSRWQAGEVLRGKHSLFISKYRLLDQIGLDPLGPVFLAQHTQMDRRVVLKTLATRGGNSAAAIERFLGEAQTLARLDHRNLCHVYDVDREGDFYYLVLEHVLGRSLQQVVDEDGPLSPEAAAGFIALAAGALSHAHRQNIFHLGVRPNRLIVDSLGELKVMDIGVANLADADDTDRSRREPGEGRSDYLAPEQVQQKEPLDARTDIYALGCVLYFLLTGQPPFAEGNEAQRRQQRCNEPARDVRTRRKEVPADVARICSKMLSRRPSDRYASADEVSAALEGWLKQLQVSRATVRAKAAAARPRRDVLAESPDVNGHEGPAPAIAAHEEASDVSTDFADIGQESKPHPVAAKPSSSRNMLLIGGGAAAAVVLLVVVVFALARGKRTTPPGDGTGATAIASAPGSPNPTPAVPGVLAFIPFPQARVRSLEGVKLEPQSDGSYLVVGPSSLQARFEIVVPMQRRDLTGLRLDTMADPDPAGTGQLTFGSGDIQVDMADNERFIAPDPVKFASVDSDDAKTKSSVGEVINGEARVSWNPADKKIPRHWAVFWCSQPMVPTGLGADSPYWLRIVLAPQLGNTEVLRRFQVRGIVGRPTENPAATPNSTEPLPIATPQDGVLAYWRFEDPTAGKSALGSALPPGAIVDTSGSGNPLYAPGGIAKYSPSIWPIVPMTHEPNRQSLDDREKPPGGRVIWGWVTNSAKFTSKRNLAAATLPAWTVEASFQVVCLGQSHGLVGKDGPPGMGGRPPFQLRVRGDNDLLEAEAIDSANASHELTSMKAIEAGRWYNVAVVSDGQKVALWLDSLDGNGFQLQKQKEDRPFAGALAAGTGEWSVGRGFVNGKPADDAMALIDEVRISSSALDPKQFLMQRPPDEVEREKVAVATRPATAAVPVVSAPTKYHPLAKLDIEPIRGLKFAQQPDGSCDVIGTADTAVYVVHAHTDVQQIRGFRLEALTEARLPNSGPGKFSGEGAPHGSFVVTEFSAEMAARPVELRRPKVPLTTAQMDAPQPKLDITHGPKGAGWGTGLETGQGHWITFATEKPIGYPGGTWLTLRIAQNFKKGFTLGRFRISTITGDQPGEDAGSLAKSAAKTVNPFAKMAAAVSLPSFDNTEATKPVSLGLIDVEPSATVKVDLRGQDTASESGATFKIEPAAGQDNKPAWSIRLHPAEGNTGEGALIAKVSLINHELRIQWTDEARSLPDANYLCNCVLEIRAAQAGKDFPPYGVALREPNATPVGDIHLGLGPDKTASKFHREILWPPKYDQIKIEILIDPKKYPAHTSENLVFSAQKKMGERKTAKLIFPQAGEPTLSVIFDSSVRRNTLYLNAEASYPFQRSANEHGTKKFEFAVEDREKVRLDSAVKKATAYVKSLGAQKKAEAAAANQELQRVAKLLDQTTKFLNRAAAIEKVGTPFRVFFTVDKYDIVLFEPAKN